MEPKQSEENVKKEGWESKKLGRESSYENETEIKRRMNRGDETKGNPNQRDAAGAAPFKETPHGHEELGENEEEAKKERELT